MVAKFEILPLYSKKRKNANLPTEIFPEQDSTYYVCPICHLQNLECICTVTDGKFSSKKIVSKNNRTDHYKSSIFHSFQSAFQDIIAVFSLKFIAFGFISILAYTWALFLKK